MRTLHRAFAAAVAALILVCIATASVADGPYRVSATSRIKDLANIEGVRQNQLIGYGLVVGLNGTGDTLNNIPFTKQSLQAMLERLGVNIRGADHPHRQRRRRHGHGQPAGVRHPGHAHRRHGVVARRRQEPARRHAAGDAAARRRRQRLRGRPGLGRDQRLPGRRRGRQDHPRRADRRPHRQRRHHRARDRLRAEPAEPGAARAAQRRLHHRQAHRRRDQRFHRHQHRRAAGSLDRADQRAEAIRRQRGVAADRDRAVADRAGPRRQDRDRRALRHHRDGPRRARLHGRGGAGQSHRHHLRDAAGQPAGAVLARPDPRRAAHQDRRAGGRQEVRRWCAKACRCSNWSMG